MEKYYSYLQVAFWFVLSTILAAILKKWTEELIPSTKTIKENWNKQKKLYIFLILFTVSYLTVPFLMYTSFVPFGKTFVLYMAIAVSVVCYVVINFRIRLLNQRIEQQNEFSKLIAEKSFETLEKMHNKSFDTTEAIFKYMESNFNGFTEFMKLSAEAHRLNIEAINELNKVPKKRDNKTGNVTS